MTILNYAGNPQGIGFPKIGYASIASSEIISDTLGSVAKSTDRIETLITSQRRNDASLMLVFFCVAFAHLNYGGLSEAAERLAVVFGSGSLNLARFTTSQRLRPLGGDLHHYPKEVANMATQSHTSEKHHTRFSFGTPSCKFVRTPVMEGASC